MILLVPLALRAWFDAVSVPLWPAVVAVSILSLMVPVLTVLTVLAVLTGYRGGAVGLAVFAFVVVLYALFSASSGAYAPEARQRAFAKELRREARENRCEPCAA